MVRVTQSMLSTNMLRNLNTSYSKMSKYQDMMTSARKFARPSDDPVAAIKGMNYRVQLDKINQFQRNLNEAEGWLDTTDTSLDQVGSTLNRIKELVIQAANDTNTPDERAKIKTEIDQIREQIKDVANTQLGEKFIFSGTHTQKPLYTKVQVIDVQAYYNSLSDADKATFIANPTVPDPAPANLLKEVRVSNVATSTPATPFTTVQSDGFAVADPNDPNAKIYIEPLTVNVQPIPPATQAPTPEITQTGQTGKVEVEVFNGIQLTVNTSGGPELFASIESALKNVSDVLADPTKAGQDIGDLLGPTGTDVEKTIARLQAKVLDARADVGARMNRVELMTNRLDIQEVNTTKQKSLNEDTDYAETITHMTTQESIHQAALSVGAKIIQQTLVDFIR